MGFRRVFPPIRAADPAQLDFFALLDLLSILSVLRAVIAPMRVKFLRLARLGNTVIFLALLLFHRAWSAAREDSQVSMARSRALCVQPLVIFALLAQKAKFFVLAEATVHLEVSPPQSALLGFFAPLVPDFQYLATLEMLVLLVPLHVLQFVQVIHN